LHFPSFVDGSAGFACHFGDINLQCANCDEKRKQRRNSLKKHSGDKQGNLPKTTTRKELTKLKGKQFITNFWQFLFARKLHLKHKDKKNK